MELWRSGDLRSGDLGIWVLGSGDLESGDLEIWDLEICRSDFFFLAQGSQKSSKIEKLKIVIQFSLGDSCFFNFFSIYFALQIEIWIKVFQM